MSDEIRVILEQVAGEDINVTVEPTPEIKVEISNLAQIGPRGVPGTEPDLPNLTILFENGLI